MNLTFRRKVPWALLPHKIQISRKRAEADAAMYAENFRWVRKTRAPELCWPWRLGQELGWRVPSPVDILFTPAANVAVAMPELEQDYFAEHTGLSDIRPDSDGGYVAAERLPWTTLYEAKFGDELENMFQPLGEGWYGWRLGWEAVLPPDTFLLVLPSPGLAGIEVAPGLIAPPGAEDVESSALSDPRFGVVIAFRPKQETQILRRQPIARIAALSLDSLHLDTRFETETGEPLDPFGADS